MVAASLTQIFLMFLLLQVGNSCAQEGEKKPPAVEEILIQLTRSGLMKFEEILDSSAKSEQKNRRLGGRKMMLKTILDNEQQVKKDINASKNHSGKSQGHLINQNERNMAGFARSLLGQSFQHSSAGSTKSRAGWAHVETQKLSDEILNLMNKDYQGGGGPRHKPPINNYDPLGNAKP